MQASRGAVRVCLSWLLVWLEQYSHIIHFGPLTPPQPTPPKGLWDGEPPERLGVAPLVPK